MQGEIRFDNVVFSYDRERTVLKGISFRVPRARPSPSWDPRAPANRRFRAFLFRFYDIQSGKVTIDNQDVRDVTQASLRAAIGIVPQDTVLFTTPSAITSAMAASTRAKRKFSRPRGWPRSIRSSASFPPATRAWSASAA